jgi:hypothetical protein
MIKEELYKNFKIINMKNKNDIFYKNNYIIADKTGLIGFTNTKKEAKNVINKHLKEC